MRLWAKMKESTLITKPFWVTAWMRRRKHGVKHTAYRVV